ncbi:MAG: glycosyltransferase [Flavobacteriales bacterium]|nr:glycosyltransferase [Flavobacteriales bacterium]
MVTKQKKIIVSVTNDLCTDQRVHKVCTSLQSNGYRVLLLGRKLSSSPEIENRTYTTRRFSLLFHKGPLFYLNYNLRLLLYLIFNSFDILLSNDLDTLTANFIASKIKNKPLVYDSHEYFTEVPELIDRKRVQQIWEKLEAWMLPKVKHSYTVSAKIAAVYHQKYSIDMEVIRNFPSKKTIISNKEDQKIIVYQGALNIGRGLEELIEAMQFVEDAKLKIAGDGDIALELKSLLAKYNLEDKVSFLGRLSILKLHELTQKASLGVSLEKELGLNYKYAVPNKIFDYIQAGVPVLYSPLVEVVSLLNNYLVGEQLMSHEPISIARQINEMLISDKKELWKSECLRAASIYNWEEEEKKLLNLFGRVG